ncbi:glucokinase [Marivita sp. XM-24bin2]|jgi:glucokinase|uniref:glucokinase n=1 Tax=unclassified Marivita TaxID=2632480 RepID=UPI000D7A6703|nr:glucokinase [Marivita sp. XM-24bin2]MCR9110096.1 glucokinase [Paracoccaceae bacterium]PWL34284.1 MAG: glucokinase [Marivita sp. XM-24bin2]
MTKTTHLTALVADLGGTNTRVALTDGGAVRTETIKRFRNAEHPDLLSVLRAYMADQTVVPDAACVAMAGPVRDGVGELTNLSWTVDRASVAKATGAKTVAVLNDLQAQGHALDHLTPDVLQTILPGHQAGDHAARLVIGVGTGMNAAAVYRLDERTLVPPSEAGHVSLPAQNSDELRLLDWIAKKHGTPGFEDVLSGRGFERVYEWLCDEAGVDAPLDAGGIMQAVNDGSSKIAEEAARMFIRMMGRAAGNLALVHLPFGGIYLIGGVARHFAPHLERLGFREAFYDKGRFSEFMEQFPVHLVDDDYAALTGSAAHLMELMG